MRDYITPLGGFLVIGGLFVAPFAFAAYLRARFWKQRADYWFARAIENQDELHRMTTRFDLHPLYEATREYESVDALIRSTGASPRVVED